MNDQQHYKEENANSNNEVSVWGISDFDNARCSTILRYPTVLENAYIISGTGRIYSILSDSEIFSGIRNNLPFVNLCCITPKGVSVEPFFLQDLVAYSFLENSKSYIERGYHIDHLDGDILNNDYHNLVYVL